MSGDPEERSIVTRPVPPQVAMIDEGLEEYEQAGLDAAEKRRAELKRERAER